MDNIIHENGRISRAHNVNSAENTRLIDQLNRTFADYIEAIKQHVGRLQGSREIRDMLKQLCDATLNEENMERKLKFPYDAIVGHLHQIMDDQSRAFMDVDHIDSIVEYLYRLCVCRSHLISLLNLDMVHWEPRKIPQSLIDRARNYHVVDHYCMMNNKPRILWDHAIGIYAREFNEYIDADRRDRLSTKSGSK